MQQRDWDPAYDIETGIVSWMFSTADGNGMWRVERAAFKAHPKFITWESTDTSSQGGPMARKFILAAVAVIVVSAVTASTAAAQDCGASCSTCGLGGYEGRSHASDGAYNMSCFSMVPYCVACPKVEMAAAHAPDAGEIANAVRTATRATIATVVSLHHARLLVVPERNLIVIKGSACDPTALRSVVRVGAATVMAFAAKGVPSLTDYLEPAAP